MSPRRPPSGGGHRGPKSPHGQRPTGSRSQRPTGHGPQRPTGHGPQRPTGHGPQRPSKGAGQGGGPSAGRGRRPPGLRPSAPTGRPGKPPGQAPGRPPLPGHRLVSVDGDIGTPRPRSREPRPTQPILDGSPRVGNWLFATRPGAEQDLGDELQLLDVRNDVRRVSEGLVVLSNERWKLRDERELAFARQGFPVAAVLKPEASIVALQLLTLLRAQAKGRLRVWSFSVWVPDGEQGNLLAQRAAKLEEEIVKQVDRLAPDWAAQRRATAAEAREEHGFYAQACLWRPESLALGVLPCRDAISLAPGGRLRMSIPEDAPSRAATKLMEAFVWLGREPEPNDLCVDLGAAPGGWTYVLLGKRARVLAVDMGKLAPSLRNKKGCYHLERDAFTFEPDEPVDWLFADLAFRPLDTAGLFCRWARRGWARFLVANIKLPMKQKAATLERIREMLLDAGWSSLKIRQLYHDREEVTVAAVCLPRH